MIRQLPIGTICGECSCLVQDKYCLFESGCPRWDSENDMKHSLLVEGKKVIPLEYVLKCDKWRKL